MTSRTVSVTDFFEWKVVPDINMLHINFGCFLCRSREKSHRLIKDINNFHDVYCLF